MIYMIHIPDTCLMIAYRCHDAGGKTTPFFFSQLSSRLDQLARAELAGVRQMASDHLKQKHAQARNVPSCIAGLLDADPALPMPQPNLQIGSLHARHAWEGSQSPAAQDTLDAYCHETCVRM